jgi:phosphoglycolate phosphatase-like HAD superfamily hydrolase
MSLRIAFDLDGTLADFDAAYRQVEERLFGVVHGEAPVPKPEVQAAAEEVGAEPPVAEGDARGVMSARSRARIWREIENTPDFWVGLQPIDATVIPRVQDLMIKYRWEVFFVTQRPETAGDTVQRQTQRWLVAQGFEWPSVIVLKRSRGKAAEALHLDFIIDDSAKNCVDVISESHCKALLVLRHEKVEHTRPQKARNLGIGVAPSISACVDLLEEIQLARSNPSILQKVARMVGWRSIG